MGIQDRDYMRERAQRRAGRGTSSRRRSGGELTDLFEFAFENQIGALLCAGLGLVLISNIPLLAIKSFFPSVDPATAVATEEMHSAFINNGFGGGLISMLPIVRLVGLALLVTAGAGMLIGVKRYGYLCLIKSKQATQALAVVFLAIPMLSVMTHGFIAEPTKAAAAASSLHIRGQSAPAQASRGVKNSASSVIYAGQPRNQAYSDPQSAGASVSQPTSAPVGLTPDRPFPPNGFVERKLPLSGNIAKLYVANGSHRANMVAIFFFNIGKGDQEAARLYLTAGQSAYIDLPTFDYRVAAIIAPTHLGLDQGYGPDAPMKDFGFIDLKTPASYFRHQPRLSHYGNGVKSFEPGRR